MALPYYSQSTLDQAEAMAGEYLLDQLEAQEIALGELGQRIDERTQVEILANGNQLDKLKRKIMGYLGRVLTKSDNQLEAIYTSLLEALTDEITTNEITVQQVAAKSAAIPVGADLADVLLAPSGEAPSSITEGTWILDARNFGPYFSALIEVLREIRDRLPALAVDLPSEEPASEELPLAIGGTLLVVNAGPNVGDTNLDDWTGGTQ